MIVGTVSQQLRLMFGLLMRATLALMATALCVHAQNSSANGIPAESKAGTSSASTYARDKIETVNLANGNFSLSIPLSTIGGRGRASFSIALSYNSKVWSAQHDREAVFPGNGTEANPVEHHSAMYDKVVDYEPYLRRLGGGWTILNAPAIKGKVIGIDPLSSGCNNFTDGVRECGTKYVLTKLWLTLPDGSQVELRDSLTDGAPALTSHIRDGYHDLIDRDRGRVWHSIDGSGVSFIKDPNDSITPDSTFLPGGWVFLADGTRLRMQTGVCSKIIDRNGNFITIVTGASGETIYTDELGRETVLQSSAGTVMVTAKGDMGAPDRSLSVETGMLGDNLRADFSALPRPFTTGDSMHDQFGNYFEHTIQGAHTDLFVESEGIIAYGSAAGEDVGARTAVTALHLPDGRAFRFRYNQYGEVAEIVYPGGGVSQIDYYGDGTSICEGSAPMNGTLNRRAGKRRTLTDGLEVDATWLYNYDAGEWSGSIFRPAVRVEAHRSGEAGELLASERHFFLALNAEYRRCGSPFTGTGNEHWENAREWRTERQTGTGLIVTERGWVQRAPVVWGNDAGSNVNAYAQQHGQDQPSNDVRVEWEETTLENGKRRRVEYGYDQFNNVTSIKEYDFGVAGGSAGGLLRETVRSYAGSGQTPAVNGSCYTNLNPLDASCGSRLASDVTTIIHQKRLLLSEEVRDAQGAREASTGYEYDNYTAGDGHHAALTINAEMTGYNSGQFSTGQTRGNVTKVSSWVEAASYVASYNHYDNAGQIVRTKDPKGYQTAISYADNFGNGGNPDNASAGAHGASYAMPTLVTNALGHQTRTQYDYTLGAATGVRDAGGVITQSIYDNIGRPVRAIAALGRAEQAVTEMSYPTATANVAQVSRQLDGARWLSSRTEFDGFDRPVLSATAEDGQHASTANFTIFSKTIYDALGRAKFSTNPYRSTGAATDGWTRNSYDLGGRLTEVSTFGGSPGSVPPETGTNAEWTGSVVTTYASEQTTVRDQAGKQRRSTLDALGRIKMVEEMLEYPSASVYAMTAYFYDARGNLKMVTQGQQTRSFIYDGLGRLLSATNPESGTTSYLYDANGNLEHRTDARGVGTDYSYDALNRVSGRTYTDNTPGVAYAYDAPEIAFSTGRLTSVSSSVSTTSYTSFDALGRVTGSSQTTDGQSYAMGYEYDLAGNMTAQTYPSGRTVMTGMDGAGRLSLVTGEKAGEGQHTYATSFGYEAGGAVGSMKLGNQLWEHTHYNSRLQPTEIKLGTSPIASAEADRLKLQYGYGTSVNNGNVLSQTITVPTINSVTGFSATHLYSYDSLNRLTSMAEAGAISQSYDYDQYGNRAITAGYVADPALTPQSVASYNPQTNRINARAYDSTGNITRDYPSQGHSYGYDAENRMVSYDGGQPNVNPTAARYSYDGDGRRVKAETASGVTAFVYDVTGKLVAEYGNAAQTGGGGTSYLTADTLGTPRIITGQSGEVKARHNYLPFGEELNVGGRSAQQGYVADSLRRQFTGYERDDETGLDYAQARYYANTQGRFTSIDPYNPILERQLSHDDEAETIYKQYLSIPQRWNRYTYVLNSPLKLNDPTGLDWFLAKGDGIAKPEWFNNDPDPEKYEKVVSYVYKSIESGKFFALNPFKNESQAFDNLEEASSTYQGYIANEAVGDSPRLPDSFSVNAGFLWFGKSYTLTRYGDLFGSGDLSLAPTTVSYKSDKPLRSSLGFSLTANWLDQPVTPDRQTLNNFNGGGSVSMTGGYGGVVLGTQLSGNRSAYSFGAGTPGANVNFSLSGHITRTRFAWSTIK